jgi:hypothetical protein
MGFAALYHPTNYCTGLLCVEYLPLSGFQNAKRPAATSSLGASAIDENFA